MNDHDAVRQRRQLDRLESATDPLIDVIGYVESLRPTSQAFGDEQFVRWVAQEGKTHAPECLGPHEVSALARRIHAAVLAGPSGIQLVNDFPDHVAVRPGPVSSCIGELAKQRQAVVVDLSIAAGVGRELWDVECESAVPIPDSLPRGEYVALTVSGDSMDPLLHSGDLVLVRRSDELKPGAIVVMRDTDVGYVVKRVGRIEPRWVELLSINPAYGRRRVRRTPGSVLGTVLLRWCQHV